VLYDVLHFPFAENSVFTFEQVDDTVLANIEGFPVIINLKGNFPAVFSGTFPCRTIFSSLTLHDFPTGQVTTWYHLQSPLQKKNIL